MKSILALLLFCTAAIAQIVQFSGAPVVSSVQYLADQYGTPALLLSTTKERSAYAGNCMTIRRASDSATQAIGFNGKDCNAATVTTFCASTTCFLTTWNDQSGNGNDATQGTTARQPQVIVDTDSKISIKTTATTQGFEVADAASIKPSKPEIFLVRARPFLDTNENSVLIGYTPTGTFQSVARWGISWDYSNGSDGQIYLTRNATNVPQNYGQVVIAGMGNAFFVNDYRPDTLDFRSSSGTQVSDVVATANITYSGTIKLMIGNSQAYNKGTNGEKWRMVVLYDQTTVGSNRNSINSFISGTSSQNLTPIPFTYTTAGGFTFSTELQIGYIFTTPDANNMLWQHEDGGYQWSIQTATNVSNGATYYRFEAQPGDLDMIVTGAERTEFNGTVNGAFWVRGGFLSEFYQLKFVKGVSVNSDWYFGNQHHTGAVAEPDNITWSGENGTVQFSTSSGTSTNRGSAQSYTLDTWYGVVIHAFWSSGGTTDTLQVYFGPNGGTLTKIIDISGSIFFPTGTGTTDSVIKQGIYASGLPTAVAIEIANARAVFTQNAYTSFITTQPALPTHPFLLKRDLDPASNDNDPMWLEKVA